MKPLRRGALALAATLTAVTASAQPATTRAPACAALASLRLPAVTVTRAEVVPRGAFTPPAPVPAVPPPTGPPFSRLPPFCRVTATLTPTSDSDIRIEVWLPLGSPSEARGASGGWNGKLQSVGNGGWAGVIAYPALATALAAGYATAATDTGHVGSNARFVPGHPEKLVDYGYRAVHEMTVAAKALVSAFYGQGPRLSYWNGCSTGGRQGLMEAQRFPADYDGIIAGAPVHDRTDQLIWELWVAQAVHRSDASYIPPAKYPAIHAAALAACDAHDGVTDGLIDSPNRCRFDPGVLACTHGDAPSCLTPPQVEAARQIYRPAIDPRSQRQIYPAMQPGSELAWSNLAGPEAVGEAVDFFRYVVFNNPAWDFRTLTFDAAVTLAEPARDILNATDPNLTPFFNRGGKLLMYHGWADQLVAPLSSVAYYTNVVAATGGPEVTTRSMRLFMMPGMTHCFGGEGPNTFDKMKVVEAWREEGTPPDRIVASHSSAGKVDRTRPLCPYPQVAVYTGSGSTDVAANFVCKAP
ncbi:MAG TPA: tannase/feruloyl esterase family alpha/beta hydrolase [Vicinamibacterales bacterium]|nr:tannase/feruloyl esterase family alpha/beta hydrolase [Vicinamibacterales bacterium]